MSTVGFLTRPIFRLFVCVFGFLCLFGFRMHNETVEGLSQVFSCQSSFVEKLKGHRKGYRHQPLCISLRRRFSVRSVCRN